MRTRIATGVAALCAAIQLQAAPVVTTTQGEAQANLARPISSSDLLQGQIPTELPGDTGWHPVNTDPLDQLPAFTDGIEVRSTGFSGLLNDFPGEGTPAKLIDYALPAPVDIGEIRVFSGNNGRDGRVFHTYTVEFASDGGLDYTAPIYVQSHPSGTLNNSGFNQWRIALTQLTNSTGPLATGVTNIRFKFYSVDNTQGQMRDPYNGVNPFTNVDDTLTAAFVSPLIWEIDVFPAEVCTNGVDDNGDGLVDCEDPQCTNAPACTCNDPFADADDDGDVDMDDFGAFQACFTGTTGAIPSLPGYPCTCFERTGDELIDQFDFAAFLACASGPSIPANAGCDDPPAALMQ